MTAPHGLTDDQLRELAEHMSDPLIMAELGHAAFTHPQATREEKATLILMALVARLCSLKAPMKSSEANKMGRILWDQLKSTGWVTPRSVLETVLRTVEGFPPTTNSALRDELLREEALRQGSGKEQA